MPNQLNKYSRKEELLVEYEEMLSKLRELLKREEVIRKDLSLEGKERMKLIEVEKGNNQEFMQQFIEEKIQLMNELEWFYTEGYH